MDMMPVKPEHKGQLEAIAGKHGRNAAAILDDAIEAYMGDALDYDRTVQAVLAGYEDVKAGRTQPLDELWETCA